MARFDPSTMQAGNNLAKAIDGISKRRFEQEKQDAEIAESKERLTIMREGTALQKQQLEFNISSYNTAQKKQKNQEADLSKLYKETQGDDTNFHMAREEIGKRVNKGGFKEGFYSYDDDTQRDNIKVLASLVSSIAMEQTTIRGLDGLKSYLMETGLIDKMREYGLDSGKKGGTWGVDSEDRAGLETAISSMESILSERSQKLDNSKKKIEFSALKGITIPGI